MHAGCNMQSNGSGEHNHALAAFLACVLGRHGACKHLGCSEHAASGRRDPVGVASRNRVSGGAGVARVHTRDRAGYTISAQKGVLEGDEAVWARLCWMQTQKSVLYSSQAQRDNADVSEEQHLYHCDDGRTRISHEGREQLLRGSRAEHITARWCAILVR